jgi:hypothetical protein
MISNLMKRVHEEIFSILKSTKTVSPKTTKTIPMAESQGTVTMTMTGPCSPTRAVTLPYVRHRRPTHEIGLAPPVSNRTVLHGRMLP